MSGNLPDGKGVSWTHDQKPGHEIRLYDNGRIEHYLKGQKIAAIDSKNVAGYMSKIHKH